METYYGSCKKNSTNKSSNVSRTKQNRLMVGSNPAAFGKKKSRFIKN